MSEIKGQGQIIYQVSNQCTSCSFHINRTNHSCDVTKRMFDFETTHSEVFKDNSPKKVSNRISPKSGIKHDQEDNSDKLCINWMNGSHFIVQTSKYLLINATADFGSRSQKVIQYISPGPYILCPKYVRFGTDYLDVKGKSLCGDGNEPKPGRLIYANPHYRCNFQ